MEEIGACHAEIVKVATNTDGSCRITLDIPEYNLDVAQKLLQLKMNGGALLQIGIVKVNNE